MDIVVRAEARDGYKLLDLERLDTYRNMDENGVMGGAFGAMGGWGHTVALCPLEEIEPTGQDFGDCASFGVVSLHDVSGLVWKRSVAEDGTGFKVTDPKFESGVEVSLAPVDGKNLAGVGGDFTTTSKDDPTTAFDDTHQFAFDAMAAGSYELSVSDGWRVMLGDKGSEDPVGNALDPLGANVALDVTPMTTSLYGFVRNEGGFPLEGLTVTANGQTATTDDLGRYIVSGIADANGEDQREYREGRISDEKGIHRVRREHADSTRHHPQWRAHHRCDHRHGHGNPQRRRDQGRGDQGERRGPAQRVGRQARDGRRMAPTRRLSKLSRYQPMSQRCR